MGKEITVMVKLLGNAKLLKRTMDALTEQTMGFDKNIQVILYGSGTYPAEHRTLCQKYIDEHPENVLLCKEPKVGAAEGSFLNCLQEGQFWQKDAFANAKKLYDNRIDHPKVVEDWYEVPEQEDEVYEDYCLNIINQVEKVPEEPGCYFFHRSYAGQVAQLIQAQRKLDAVRSLFGILLDAGNIGILKNNKMYGKRTAYAEVTSDWYVKELPAFAEELAQMKQGAYGKYRQNLDFLLMYQIADALKQDATGVLDAASIEEFRDWLKGVLSGMDDYVIVKGKMNGITRRYALSLKYGTDITDRLIYRNGKLLFANMVIYNLKHSICFRIEGETDDGDGMLVTGSSNHPLPTDAVEFYYADETGREYPFEPTGEVREEKRCLDQVMQRNLEYKCKLPHGCSREELVLMYRYQGSYTGEVQTE